MQLFFVWLFFLLGAVLAVFAQAQLRISSPLNGYRDAAHYYSLNLWLICLRLFLGSMAFWAIASGSNHFDVFLPDSSWDLRLPWIAGFSGVGLDSGLSKLIALLGLEKIVPPVGGTVTTDQTQKATTAEETTKVTTTD